MSRNKYSSNPQHPKVMDRGTIEEGLWMIARALAEETRQQTTPTPRGVRGQPEKEEFPLIPGRGARMHRGDRRPGVNHQPRNPVNEEEPQPGPSRPRGHEEPAHLEVRSNSELKRPQPATAREGKQEAPRPPGGEPSKGERNEAPIQDPRGARPRRAPSAEPRDRIEPRGQHPRGIEPRRVPVEQSRQQGIQPPRDVRMAKLKDRQEWMERGAKVGLKTPQLAHENARCYNCAQRGHLRDKCENKKRRFCRTCFEDHEWFGPKVGWRCRYAEADWHLARVQQDRAERERKKSIKDQE